MVLYLSFPVAMFWAAGEIQIYQEALDKPKLFPPEDDYQMRMEFEDLKERMRKKREAKLLAEAKD